MKTFLRNIFLNFLSLLLISKLTSAINFADNFVILFWAALCLTLFNLLIKPLLNLLMTPINLLTLGAFRWVINVIVLFLVTIFVPGFKIVGFSFNGLSLSGFVIPSFHLSFFWSLVLVSFIVEVISGMFSWLLK